MKNRIFVILFLLCVSFSANATLIFTLTGDTTSATENVHTFDINSVVLTSTEGYSLDSMISSILSLSNTSSAAYFNGYTSKLSQTNFGTDYVVETTESHSLSFEKEASILELGTNNLILEGLLTVESLVIYDGITAYSGSGSFTMQFNTNSSDSSGSVSPVPVPATFWLLGSGLIGLVGVARRKKV